MGEMGKSELGKACVSSLQKVVQRLLDQNGSTLLESLKEVSSMR